MITNKRTVAVLLAAYNGEKYLKEQLDSLLGQSFKDFTCFIHDDGSSDGTAEIFQTYAEEYPDTFVIVPGSATGGAKNNFIFLMKEVDSEYYMFCDQDDVWLADKIGLAFAEIKKHDGSAPQCVYTDLKVVDENLMIINESFYDFSDLDPKKNAPENLLMTNVCAGCTMMINRRLRDLCLSADFPLFEMHDWLAALIASFFGELHFLDEKTMLYRQHGTNEVGASREYTLIRKLVRAVDVRAFFERKKYFRERPGKMVRDLLKVRELPDDAKKFLRQADAVRHAPKLRRMQFYRKHGMYRQRVNKFWQLLWL